jgi:hypothetical protein
MGNTQGIEFKTIEEFLDYLAEDELEIVLYLRKIILECISNGKEKLAFNVPFYYRHSRICYIWPASIPWGKVEKGVAIGFCKGSSLLDETFDSTRFTSKLTFTSVKEIDTEVLKQHIYEAVFIDEQIAKAKRRKIQ